MDYIIAAVLAYFLGSFPTVFLTGKWLCGIDIRQYGSKNIGTTNMFRTLGVYPASIVLIVDILKGVLSVAFAMYLTPNIGVHLLAAALAIVGHNYSCWLGFKGGRGVATSLGILLTLMPLTSLLVFAVWALIVFITRYVSLGSIIGAALTPILAYYFEYDLKIQLFSGFMALLVIVGHKDNIKRLLTGTENKIKSGNMNNIKK